MPKLHRESIGIVLDDRSNLIRRFPSIKQDRDGLFNVRDNSQAISISCSVALVYAELSFRLAYAFARRVPEFKTREAIDAVCDELGDKSPKERRDFFLYRLRRIYYDRGWGWEPNFLSTPESYLPEGDRLCVTGCFVLVHFDVAARKALPIDDQLRRKIRQWSEGTPSSSD